MNPEVQLPLLIQLATPPIVYVYRMVLVLRLFLLNSVHQFLI
jgi:hypothetical protein